MTRRVGTLVVGHQSRAQRRRAAWAERRLANEIRNAEKKRDKELKEAQKSLWKGDYLPSDGEAGDRMGSAMLPAYLATTRLSSKKARVQYPFVAEEGLGHQGVLVGYDKISHTAFCFDPFEAYTRGLLSNTNITLTGAIGTGKSSLMKCFALRSLVFGRRTFIPGDVKGEWSELVRAVGGSVISVGGSSTARLNPLDEGRRPERDKEGRLVDDELWRRMVARDRRELLGSLVSGLLDRRLTQEEHTALNAALEAAVARGGIPVVPTVMEELLAPSGNAVLPLGVRDVDHLVDMGRNVGFALQRLVNGDLMGMFDGPSTVSFDPLAPMMSVDLCHIPQGSKALGLIMTCTSTWLESALRGWDLGQRYIVYEEAHRLMALPGFLDRMKDSFKLTRAWGTANVVALHRLSDLDAVGRVGSQERALAEGLLADTETRIVYRQESDQLEASKEALGMTDVGAEAVAQLRTGSGLWMVGKKSFLVAHQRTTWEAELTDTDSAIGKRAS